MGGHKELLGMWLSENEGAKFWLNILTELNNRGVKDILIALALEQFATTWDHKSLISAKAGVANWENLNTFLITKAI